ncbi:cyclic nucleotide-binding protein [Thalassovita sp.]|uniref:Acb2/Tad1 domain-containing protein n=1 Tax=Thalassovita sp. TaxID=1979401 RepID=UPI002B266B0B|nr:cyclic nucleotide-binding protein [Thalassovita sp.]
MTQHTGLPVSGYRPQSKSAVETVNRSKYLEERVLRLLDELAASDVDKRWLAVGRTQIEQGFMAVNRSVFQPGRVALAEDEA